MGSRLDLHTLLSEIPGVKKAYFQAPNGVLEYPCIIYKRERSKDVYGDNRKYFSEKGYFVQVIDPDPDSNIPDLVNALPKTSFVRHYTVDRLNHDIFTIFY